MTISQKTAKEKLMEDERRKQLEKIKREKEEKDRILAQVLNSNNL